MADDSCAHIEALTEIRTAKRRVCDACEPLGARWVHLRTCQSCGTTLCCDSSPNRHASAHARSSGHPVVASAEPGEHWLWCYVDELFVETGPGR